MQTAPETGSPLVEPARLRAILDGSVENLLATWADERALFPFASRLDGGRIVNDYDPPWAVRYTITSLLGLLEAQRAGVGGLAAGDVEALLGAFLRRAGERIEGAADLALLTLLLCSAGFDERDVRRALARLRTALGVSDGHLHAQDLAWSVWGATAAAERGIGAGADLAEATLTRIKQRFVEAATGLPRHSTRVYRRGIVSFGSLTYFLRAMHEAARVLGDAEAEALFTGGVRKALAIQGPRGEWPWMMDIRTGIPFDFYPVFAVHQDAMAMLFLHPALDLGFAGVPEAIERSFAWTLGENELGLPMYVDDPFFAYRSIERVERAPRLRRYSRSFLGGAAAPAAARVRLNAECRSYHLGWLLYAWSARVV
jgi:hypothetical protein